MTNPRSAARQLALRILYQVDLGDQTVAEAIDNALEVVSVDVRNPVHQQVEEAIVELRRLALLEPQPHLLSHVKERKQLVAAMSAALHKLDHALSQSADKAIRRTEDLPDDVSIEVRLSECESRVDTLGTRFGGAVPEAAALAKFSTDCAREMAAEHDRLLPAALAAADFATSLATGADGCRAELDRMIAKQCVGWTLERLPAVDRNVLRLGLYELLYVDDTPTAVCLNEAIELAKLYGAEESGKFVNGVLGAIANERRGAAV